MKGKKLLIGLVSLIALAAIIAVPVMAQDSTEITGEVLPFIEITAPSDINLGIMAIGNNDGVSNTPGSVLCNAEFWAVMARDEKETNCGYMVSESNVLGNMFQISEDSFVYESANPGITYAGNPTALPLYVKQEITQDDLTGAYIITITFTGVL